MKKLLILAVSIFGLASLSHAFEPVWLSSNTQTNDVGKNLCVPNNYVVGLSTITSGGRGILHGICLNNPSSNGGQYSVWTSSPGLNVSFSTVAVVTTFFTSPACNYYDVITSSGLYYTNSSTGNVTALYTCF